MAQSPLTGATERIYNNAALPPPWQRGKTFLLANDPHTKKRKLEAYKTNMSKSQTNPSASQVTTHNRFAIQDTTEDPMDITEAVNRQHTQRTPPPSPIFIDDVIDIQTMTKIIEKDISKKDYKLKISADQPRRLKKINKVVKNPECQLPHLPAQARKTTSCGATQHPPLNRSRRTKVRTLKAWPRSN